MVRKKSDSYKKTKPFAPTGKLLMIERNRSMNSPKTPRTSISTPAFDKKALATPLASGSKPKSSTKRRFRPGTKAIREIRKYQSTTGLLVPKASFSRVVREIMQHDLRKLDYKFSTMAMTALQEATEMAIVNLLEVANLCCIHAKRVTLAPSDIRLTKRAFGLGNPLND